MILLTDGEIRGTHPYWNDLSDNAVKRVRVIAEAQVKKALISVGKESKRMDGTIYLVPDYVEYREALKGVGLE